MTDESNSSPTDSIRLKYGFWIIMSGLIIVMIAFLVATFRWQNAEDVTATVGIITSFIGTLVGAYLGIKIGSEGKDKEVAERKKAEKKAFNLAGRLDPEKFAEYKKEMKNK